MRQLRKIQQSIMLRKNKQNSIDYAYMKHITYDYNTKQSRRVWGGENIILMALMYAILAVSEV